MSEPSESSTNGYCTACGSGDLAALPPNQFSRKPGFVCNECDTRHRSGKSTFVYAGIVLLGLAIAGIGISVFFLPTEAGGGAPRRSPLRFIVLGAAVAGWAAWQFRVPTVDSSPKATE